MATLIRVPTEKNTRRCTATCYNAKGQTCYCVCGGLNHGVGLERAMANTSIYIEGIREAHPTAEFPEVQLTLLKEEKM